MYENFVAQKYMLSYSHIFPSNAGNVHITVIESPPELPWTNQISTAYELGDPTTMVHEGSPSGSRQNSLEHPLFSLYKGSQKLTRLKG